MICNLDCFNCIYPDCVNEGDLSDGTLSQALDRYAMQDSKLTPQQRYKRSKKGKISMHKSNTNESGRARMTRYNHSEKGKARLKRYEQTEKRKAYRREWERRKRAEAKRNECANNSRENKTTQITAIST